MRWDEAHLGNRAMTMTPFCERRPDESITAWHRRIHDTSHDWRDVAEFLTLRGLHAESKMVTSVAHLRREERTVALLGVAEERDKDAVRVIRELPLVAMPATCGNHCVLEEQGAGPCMCHAPMDLHRLRQRARSLRWAAEALMRPDPVKTVELVNKDKPEAVRKLLADQMTERAGGLARSAVTSTK